MPACGLHPLVGPTRYPQLRCGRPGETAFRNRTRSGRLDWTFPRPPHRLALEVRDGDALDEGPLREEEQNQHGEMMVKDAAMYRCQGVVRTKATEKFARYMVSVKFWGLDRMIKGPRKSFQK